MATLGGAGISIQILLDYVPLIDNMKETNKGEHYRKGSVRGKGVLRNGRRWLWCIEIVKQDQTESFGS